MPKTGFLFKELARQLRAFGRLGYKVTMRPSYRPPVNRQPREYDLDRFVVLFFKVAISMWLTWWFWIWMGWV